MCGIYKTDIVIETGEKIKTKVVEVMFFETAEDLYDYHFNLSIEYELKFQEIFSIFINFCFFA